MFPKKLDMGAINSFSLYGKKSSWLPTWIWLP